MLNVRCPVCEKQLERATLPPRHHYYRCREHGFWAHLHFFRSFPGSEFIERSLLQLRQGPFPLAANEERRPCSFCKKPTQKTYLEAGSQTVVDQCFHCDMTWFDLGELEGFMPSSAPPKPKGDLRLTFPSQQEGMMGLVDSFHPLQLLGLPVENERSRPKGQAVLTFGLLIGIFLFTARGLQSETFFLMNQFDPGAPFRHGGFTFLTGTLLHASWWHFFGNAYFFYVVADNIEEEFGPGLLLALFFLSAFGGKALYLVSGGQQPTIGASAGILGLLVFYCLRFPRNTFDLGFIIRFRLFNLRFPAPFFLVFYLAPQLLGAFLQYTGGHSSINYLGHFGGALVGLIFHWAQPRSPA